jgi:ubiquinone biosynthesis protein COQ4
MNATEHVQLRPGRAPNGNGHGNRHDHGRSGSNGRIMSPHPVRPLAALRLMRQLVNDPDNTSLVFEIVSALSGRGFERLFDRVMADPTGARILEERRSLLPVLDDRERLRVLPEGSLGREYALFMDAERISAGGLAEASLVTRTEFYDDRAKCLSERLRDMHDLWHVVTGYGRDLVGEAGLLAFTYGQTRNRGVGFIVAMGALKFWQVGRRDVVRVVLEGWRRGRRAAFLPAADWDAMLERPLERVRRELRIELPPAYEAVFSADAEAARAGTAMSPGSGAVG